MSGTGVPTSEKDLRHAAVQIPEGSEHTAFRAWNEYQCHEICAYHGTEESVSKTQQN